jgi:hypothetical protein
MRSEQTVSEMAEEVLSRQARAHAQRTGQSLAEALEVVLKTPAGSLRSWEAVRINTRRRATGKGISCLSVRPSRLGCRGRCWRCGEANRSTSDV